MASIGQVTAAATNFRADNTSALVNVNLELNLFTRRFIKPPREYAEVGQRLAPSRLREAEGGTRHTIARKLGILFKDSKSLPSTPELIKAYGLRSSEISRDSVANPRGNVSHGPFAEMIGADATTLWAAATSGRYSIQCHLLACLLARIWEPVEATSIWVEIVSRRKEDLKLELDEEGELSVDVACILTEELSRSDLRDWDASVRAWMRVADSVMIKQQTQARLIVDNVSLPVNTKPDTYESVMNAWYSSMTQMEKLLNGIPLQVYGGDVLLALLAWHLYPDMMYLSNENQRIEQNDPLLKGRGILTLGLEPSPRVTQDCKSVYWTLPLSHLRYYGRLPITRTQSIRTSDRDRITIDELLWAKISAYITDWDNRSVSTEDILELVGDVMMRLHRAYLASRPLLPRNDVYIDTWMMMVHRICLKYKGRLGEARVRKLKAMGQRFAVPSNNPLQKIFSLAMYLEVGRNLEDKILFMREIASSVPTLAENPEQYEYLIACKHSFVYELTETGFEVEGFEYATAHPVLYDVHGGIRKHQRWLFFNYNAPAQGKYSKMVAARVEEIKNMGEEATVLDASSFGLCSKTNIDYHLNARIPADMHRQIYNHITACSKNKASVRYSIAQGDIATIALLQFPPNQIINQKNKKQFSGSRHTTSNQESTWKTMQLMRSDTVDWPKLVERLFRIRAEGDIPAEGDVSLLGMKFIEILFRTIPGATVDVRAVQFDLSMALWCSPNRKRHNSSTPRTPNRKRHNPSTSRTLEAIAWRTDTACLSSSLDTATCFACIAMMETGSYNLNPDELQDVFAVCVADSMYIASALVGDPVSRPACPIKRFTGNIGRSGMSFMVPPKAPEIKSYDTIDEWYQYEHKEFDGTMEDCFEGTSLHLSFSEASQAINIGFSGGQDVEAYFLETLISVYERENWIADLDILRALKCHPDYLEQRFLARALNPCKCEPTSARWPRIISIDNFAEMIIPPMKAGIIRASGNWQARLAAVSICLAKGCRVVLKPENTCWGCFSQMNVAGFGVESYINDSRVVVMII